MLQQSPQFVTCSVCSYNAPVFKDKSTDRVYCPVCSFPLDPDGPIPLDDLTITKYVEVVTKPTLILFWAPWEKSSDEMRQLLAVETQSPRSTHIAAVVNVDENPESRRHFGIELIPTIIIYSFGREVNRIVGVLSSFDLSRLMRKQHF